MKNLKFWAMALVATLCLASCQKDDETNEIIDPVSENIIVMNNGNWGDNDASITGCNFQTGTVAPGLFLAANGQHLGDLGQDMVRMGDNIYIAVNGSKVIFVTDMAMKIKTRITASTDAGTLSPRSFCATGKKIYVTYYEGFLGEIDPTTYTVRLTPVGNSPEGVAAVGGKIYVANSGGALYPDFEKTISVVDAASFKETQRIEVGLNPQSIVPSADGRWLYVNSFGNYNDVPAKLQRVSVASGDVYDLDYTDVKAICGGSENVLYVVTGSYNEAWQVTGTVNIHDMNTDTKRGTLAADITNFYSISYSDNLIFVGTSDYQTNGDVYLYGEDGQFIRKFDSQGLNPIKGLRL